MCTAMELINKATKSITFNFNLLKIETCIFQLDKIDIKFKFNIDTRLINIQEEDKLVFNKHLTEVYKMCLLSEINELGILTKDDTIKLLTIIHYLTGNSKIKIPSKNLVDRQQIPIKLLDTYNETGELDVNNEKHLILILYINYHLATNPQQPKPKKMKYND